MSLLGRTYGIGTVWPHLCKSKSREKHRCLWRRRVFRYKERACIDVPWGTLPLSEGEWRTIRQILSIIDGLDIILISSSGTIKTKNDVGFPVATCLVWRESGQPLFNLLIKRLTRHSFKILPDGFEKVSHTDTTLT